MHNGSSGTDAMVDEWSQLADAARFQTIDVNNHDLMEVTALTWQALAATNDPPTLFRFGGRPARIELDDSGGRFVRTLNWSRMRNEAARRARWRGGTGDREHAVAPPKDVVENLLADAEVPLPILNRIVEAPVFAADGSLEFCPGYHAVSRTYYVPAPNLRIPAVADTPSVDDVAEARALIVDELLADFPFVGDAERAHAVAAMLLPYIRDLIPGPTPLFLIEKPTPGTGAGLLAQVLMLPAMGRPPATMTEGSNDEEWRKRLTAKLMTAPVVIQIDNLARRLEAPSLAAVLTSPMWEDRRLGISEIVNVPVRCVWLATGNNPSLSNEMARRVVRIRLDARVEHPFDRTEFRHVLPDWAMQERGRLIWSALTLGRAWLAAGRPSGTLRTLGSFEAWSQVTGGILEIAGVGGFLENVKEIYDIADAEGVAIRILVERWWEAHRANAVGVSDLWKLVSVEDSPINLDLGAGGERSQKTRFGKLLTQQRDRQYAGYRIMAAGKEKGAQQWCLEPADAGEPR